MAVYVVVVRWLWGCVTIFERRERADIAISNQWLWGRVSETWPWSVCKRAAPLVTNDN
jgi:hypothetical protein